MTKKRRGGANCNNEERQLRLVGPEWMQTLRGKLLGREVVFICCGESHEDAIDLTRRKAIVEPQLDWVQIPPDMRGFDPEDVMATQEGLTLAAAKSWAQNIIERDDSSEDSETASGESSSSAEGDEITGLLVFVPNGGINRAGKAKGTAILYDGDTDRSAVYMLPAGATVYMWYDVDEQARDYNGRRLAGEEVPVAKHDALIAERKAARLSEGIELFDDWIIRQAQATGGPHVEVVLETSVVASEVELHVQPGATLPCAHECLRCIEEDSEESSDEEADPDDGSGCFIDYLHRRVLEQLQTGVVHSIDPRELGDPDDEGPKQQAFKELLTEPLPEDLEEVLLKDVGATESMTKKSDNEERRRRRKDFPPLPSWEAFFGAASQLLYYSANVKADYTPFLSKCVGSSSNLRLFFHHLYFGTIDDALSVLRLDDATFPLTRIRSRIFQPAVRSSQVYRRSHDYGYVPIKAAPLDRYLKARGSFPPRTWVSALAVRLRERQNGAAANIANAAELWFGQSVEHLLADPKTADETGDYFAAWLRECHRDIYDDIDHTDPEELCKLKYAKSSTKQGKDSRYYLGDIRIPSFEDAFAEVAAFDPQKDKPSTRRQRVLAKLLVDVPQLRLVDLACILTMADIVAASEEGAQIVVIFYGGSDHAQSVQQFWRGQGFTDKGLPQQGKVGKEEWDEDESRALELPNCLQNIAALFPIP